jgi:TolB-like protein
MAASMNGESLPEPAPDGVSIGLALGEDELEKRREKKRAKVRSAWISFVGRIVAQIMGAVATISLGLMLVQKYHAPAAALPVPAPVRTEPSAAVPVRLVTPGEISLAVLPLEDVSADGEGSFARGMTDALITDLVQLDGVRVVSRTSSAAYEKERRLLPQIAKELGVDFVVDGSVTNADGRVRIAVRLIDGQRDEHLLAASYDRPLRQVLAVQAEVAHAITRAVKVGLASAAHASPGVVSRRKSEPLPAIFGAR